MRFLFIVRQKKNIDTFQDVITRLLANGQEVRLGVQERLDDEARASLSARFTLPGFELVACPEGRGDQWRASAPLVRSARDWAQYLRPHYRGASKLRDRAWHRFMKALGGDTAADGQVALDGLPGARVQHALEQWEAAIPSDPLHEEFLRRHDPDVVLVTPGLHFGSAQTDFIKAARAIGIPVWMLLFSWDNLSTKGALHEAPDLMFVWNERQRREATELHDYPANRVIVVGAPRFDEFFTLKPVVPRDEFLAPLALDSAAATLLYVCSSRFIADRELPFIQQWLTAVRASANPELRGCNVIIRPHPDVVLVEGGPAPAAISWPSLPQATGWVQRPFDDANVVVLRTTYATPQAFYECLHHAAAVVGLNTSAELEAGIAGRPVYTLLANHEEADGQTNTLHFNYLLREHGGFVECAPDLPGHIAHLSEALTSPPEPASIRAFIDEFLRPRGKGPVAGVLANALVSSGSSRQPQQSESARSVASGVPVASGFSRQSEPPPDDSIGVPEEPRKKVVIGYPGSTARVLVTPETRRMRSKGVLVLDPATVAWLDEHVSPGDVLYDIGAGIGAYTLVAALHRGAVCIAFEPGFATFKRLCDNLLLNGCSRSVIPLPLALGEQAGLLELEYSAEAGGHSHTLAPREWRPGRDALDAHYTQPVCADRLDAVVQRHHLLKPQVIRIAMRRGAASALSGAGLLLADPHVRSVLATVKGDEESRAVADVMAGHGFSTTAISETGMNRTLVLARTTQDARPEGGFLRRVAGRMRPTT